MLVLNVLPAAGSPTAFPSRLVFKEVSHNEILNALYSYFIETYYFYAPLS